MLSERMKVFMDSCVTLDNWIWAYRGLQIWSNSILGCFDLDAGLQFKVKK